MGVEFLIVLLAVALFFGIFLALFLSYRDTETRRSQVGAAWRHRAKPMSVDPSLAVSDDLKVRRFEHHLRHEALIAEEFLCDPKPHTLHASGQSHDGGR